MLETMKMAQAYKYLDRAIWWDALLRQTSPERNAKVEMLLNKACQLELEALGLVVYTYKYKSTKHGELIAAFPSAPTRGTIQQVRSRLIIPDEMRMH
jgi:hypothetical protein